MDLVSVIEKTNLLVPTDTSTTIVTEREELVEGERIVNAVINTVEQAPLLVEVQSSIVILAGQPGPAGTPSEDNIMYASRVDFINDNLLYRAEAAPGSLDNSAVWRIRRIEISAEGDVTTTWATGSSDFLFKWSDRSIYSYV